MKKPATVTRRKVTPVPENVTLNRAGQDLQAFSALLDRWNHEHSAGGCGASPPSPAAQLVRGRRCSRPAAPADDRGQARGSPRSAQVSTRCPIDRDDWGQLERAAARTATLVHSIEAMEVQIGRLRTELEEARRQERRIAAEAVIQVMRRFRIGQDVVRPMVEGSCTTERCLAG
jgi:hypothetical protein